MLTVYVQLSEEIEVHQGSRVFTLPAGVETVVWSCWDADKASEVLAIWAQNPYAVRVRIERSQEAQA